MVVICLGVRVRDEFQFKGGSVIELNPDALTRAGEADQERLETGGRGGLLHGIPRSGEGQHRDEGRDEHDSGVPGAGGVHGGEGRRGGGEVAEGGGGGSGKAMKLQSTKVQLSRV
ncbi:uncharacterized protein A4U43_C10F16640 [Asparagus officinalis]|uniref:Uncharacterized protein n=1 Tax=Asparagus officinalis TaxID=4686 RepID=A0A5P1E376_ASPOF|nr:uncharacterized protein A4U43_C10F16640 [Asparagus officinalis]